MVIFALPVAVVLVVLLTYQSTRLIVVAVVAVVLVGFMVSAECHLMIQTLLMVTAASTEISQAEAVLAGLVQPRLLPSRAV